MKRLFSIIIALVLLLSTVSALQIKGADEVTINEPVNENLLVAGGMITIDAPVNGDIMATGGEIRINSVVNGDVLAAGGRIYVKNNVTGDVRVTGGQIDIEGNVRGDVLATGGEIWIETGTPIGGDVLASGGRVTVNSDVKGDVRLSGGDVKIDKTINGDVSIKAESISLAEGALIKGNLNYTSPKEAELKKEQVNGTISRQEIKVEKRVPSYAFTLAWKIFASLALLLIAIIIVLIMPSMSLRLSNNIRYDFWKSLLLGLVSLVVVPVAALLIGITMIGLPITIIIILLYLIAIYISKIFAALWIGKLFFRKPQRSVFRNVVVPVTIGIVIYVMLVSIPYIGWIVRILGMLLGLGAMTIVMFKLEKKGRR